MVHSPPSEGSVDNSSRRERSAALECDFCEGGGEKRRLYTMTATPFAYGIQAGVEVSARPG